MDRHRGDRDRDRDRDRDNRHYSRHPGGRSSERYPGNHHHNNGPRGAFSDGPNRSFNGPQHQSYSQSVSGGGAGGGGCPPFRPVGDGEGFSGRKRDSGGGFTSSGRGHSSDRSDSSRFAKLFIGSVPRTATEEEIRPLFEDQGDVIEVALIKDRRTGQQQGCCFVKYATPEDADRAIRALHNQVTLPGGLSPIQVRYADGERERLGKFQGANEHKLFVGSLNKQATEKEVEEIFSPYGHVEDVYLMKDDLKQSRGCGFVKFSHRDMAAAAMNALNGTYVMRGCEQPLIVRFADPKRPRGADSRLGPTFGGPGFGPQSQPPSGVSSPNLWHPMSPHRGAASSQFSSNAFGSHLPPRDAAVPVSSTTVGSVESLGGPIPTNASFSSMNATQSSMLQQGFNSSILKMQSFGTQMSPLQKPTQMPQQPASLHLQPQLTSPFSQMHSSQTPGQQLSQMQLSSSVGHTSLPVHTVPIGLSREQTASQHPLQQGGLQPSINLSNQQHLQPSVSTPISAIQHPQLLQPLQQVASQVPLQQQLPGLPSGFQAIPQQQAFSQLQQQLHLMQQQPSTQTQQQNPQATNKLQASWNVVVPQTIGNTPAISSTMTAPSGLSSTIMVASATTPAASLTCNWTEHTSPEGYKYYYNSLTGESKWEKPKELTLFEQQKLLVQQQQQQQKHLVPQIRPQMQNQPHAEVVSSQQSSQVQPTQMQPQLRQPQHLQLQQPSMYQASAASGQQNVQGLQATQEWMWKNKPTGS